MAWYSAGTVALTKDSNVVTGAGTQFILNTKASDIFIGPDGLLYEVDRIVSDTQLVLKKNYLSESNTAASYTIIPTTAYLKTLAAQVADLIALYSDVPQNTQAAQAAATEALSYRNDANAAMASSQAARDAAETWKTQAATSASSASASASTAVQARSDAEAARDAAAASRDAAVNAKNAAESARDAAAASASQAASSVSWADNKLDKGGGTLKGAAQFWYEAKGIDGGYALGFHYLSNGAEKMSIGGLGAADATGNWQTLFMATGGNGYDQSQSPSGVWVDVGGTLRTKGSLTHSGTAMFNGPSTTFGGTVTVWASPSAPLVLSSAAPVVVLREEDQTLPKGLWRLVADGDQFQIRKNTAAAGDFSTETTPFVIDPNGKVALANLSDPALSSNAAQAVSAAWVKGQPALSGVGWTMPYASANANNAPLGWSFFDTGTANTPTGAYGAILTTSNINSSVPVNGNWLMQIAVDTNNPARMFVRNNINNTGWVAWREVIMAGSGTATGSTSVSGTVSAGAGFVVASTNLNQSLICNVNTTNPSWNISFNNPAGTVGTIVSSGSGVSYNTTSDYRLKQNYAPITGALASINRIKFYTGEFKTDPGKLVDYCIAHELQAECGFAVCGEKDAVQKYPVLREGADPNDIQPEDVIGIEEVVVPQSVDYAKLVPRIGASVQELSALLEAAVERIAALEAANTQSN